MEKNNLCKKIAINILFRYTLPFIYFRIFDLFLMSSCHLSYGVRSTILIIQVRYQKTLLTAPKVSKLLSWLSQDLNWSDIISVCFTVIKLCYNQTCLMSQFSQLYAFLINWAFSSICNIFIVSTHICMYLYTNTFVYNK